MKPKLTKGMLSLIEYFVDIYGAISMKFLASEFREKGIVFEDTQEVRLELWEAGFATRRQYDRDFDFENREPVILVYRLPNPLLSSMR